MDWTLLNLENTYVLAVGLVAFAHFGIQKLRCEDQRKILVCSPRFRSKNGQNGTLGKFLTDRSLLLKTKMTCLARSVFLSDEYPPFDFNKMIVVCHLLLIFFGMLRA